MAINSYFYDSVGGDRPYSAKDFAHAFNMILETGVVPSTISGALGFGVSGTNKNIIGEGRAVVNGHFVEVTGTETLTVPTGSYSGQIVIRVDADDARRASLIVKTDQQPVQDATLYEMPLYNCVVTDGVITSTTDLRSQGGAVAKTAPNIPTWSADTNGVRLNMGLFGGTGKPVVLFLTSAQPSASSAEHRVWIQIDKF